MSKPSAPMFVTRLLLPDLDAEAFEIPSRTSGEVFVEGRKDSRSGLNQDDARQGRVDVPKISGQGKATHLADRPGELDTCRTPAHDREGQKRPLVLGPGLLFSLLERRQHPSSNFGGLLQGFETWCVHFPLFVAKIRVLGPAGQHDIVVGVLARIGDHHAPGQIDVEGPFPQDPDVAGMRQDPADRRGDLGRAQPRGRDLVEEWPKEVVVALIEQGDPDIACVGEPLGGIETREPTTDDDHTLHHRVKIAITGSADQVGCGGAVALESSRRWYRAR